MQVTNLRIDVRGEMLKYDRTKVGNLSKELFVHALDEIQITHELNDQEMLTVMRRFGNENNKYQYDELCDLFSHVFYIKNTGNRDRSRNIKPGEDFEKIAFLDMLKGNKTQLRRFRFYFFIFIFENDSKNYISIGISAKMFIH